VRGGHYRCRENDCWRLAEESPRVIDHMNAVGAPFSREYGGTLATRSFGGVQVSRTYYTRGQTGQQLQLATTSALQRQIGAGSVEIFTHNEMMDLIIDGGRCQGIVTRDLLTGEIRPWTAHVVALCTGGYGSVYHWSTLAKELGEMIKRRQWWRLSKYLFWTIGLGIVLAWRGTIWAARIYHGI